MWCVLALTIVFGYFSLKTEFDSDMRNINYMTDEQKSDLSYFQNLLNASDKTEHLYIVSSGNDWDGALTQDEIIRRDVESLVSDGYATKQNSVSTFLVSKQEQQKRINKWKDVC